MDKRKHKRKFRRPCVEQSKKKQQYACGNLSISAVLDIRNTWRPSRTTKLAQKYGRTNDQILDIVYGRTYQYSSKSQEKTRRKVTTKAIFVHWCEANLC